MKEDKTMISFTKKNRSQNTPESDYNGNDSYNGYSDYSSDYVSSDFGDEVNEEAPAEYTEPTLVDKKPEEDLKSTIKLINFTTPADREKVAEALKDGCAVILDLTDLDRSDWFRVIDYIQGAIFMIGGTISRFSENALVAAPKNFDVSKIEEEELSSDESEEETEPDEKAPAEEETPPELSDTELTLEPLEELEELPE